MLGLCHLVTPGKGDNKLGKMLERVRADVLASKDTEIWCAMRFQLAAPLDVAVDFAVTKAGEVVAEPSLEGKPVVRMGEPSRGMLALGCIFAVRVCVFADA